MSPFYSCLFQIVLFEKMFRKSEIRFKKSDPEKSLFGSTRLAGLKQAFFFLGNSD